MGENAWPPIFTLDQEKILNLLTGDRFYSNPSAALREAVLNAIDAINRRRKIIPELLSEITVVFERDDLTLTVSDNGIGMSRNDVNALFTKVGASAATAENNKDSVGEFGIGVISYFMAGDAFELQTNDGNSEPIGLYFDKNMFAGGSAVEAVPVQKSQGTTVKIRIRDITIFNILIENFPYWCRDVEGLYGQVLPEKKTLDQGRSHRVSNIVEVAHPEWVERAHLGPIEDSPGWDNMTGVSRVAVLYRGVFVQEFEVKRAWGIEGSIDVDPKHFKPRLNREGFVEGKFQTEVDGFLQACHPTILVAMASRLTTAVKKGELSKWNEKRWASLWLSIPRDVPYADVVKAWDTVFRSLPAFEHAVGNIWEGISLDQLKKLGAEIFLAPLAEEPSNDVVRSALRFLRNTGHEVIRGISKDRSWMKFAPATFGTTADLISKVFASELPTITPIAPNAESIIENIKRSAPLFTGPPLVDLVRLGNESPPVLRLKNRLVINTDNPAGAAIVQDVLRDNGGPISLITITARHAYQQLTEVAAAVREITAKPEILSPIRRRYIRSHLP
jgi:hypothetical protein